MLQRRQSLRQSKGWPAKRRFCKEASRMTNARSPSGLLRESLRIANSQSSRQRKPRRSCEDGGVAFCSMTMASVYRAEFPRSSEPVMRSIPKTFLTGSCAFEIVSSPSFVEDLTDDPADRKALLSMRPVSSAAITLVSDDGRHRGVLVACSTEGKVKSRSFEALECLSEIVAQRALELQHTLQQIPEFRTENCWESLRERRLTIEVYRSKGCAVPWRYRQFSDAHGLLTLNIDDDDPVLQKTDAPLGRKSLAEISRNRGDEFTVFCRKHRLLVAVAELRDTRVFGTDLFESLGADVGYRNCWERYDGNVNASLGFGHGGLRSRNVGLAERPPRSGGKSALRSRSGDAAGSRFDYYA